MSGSTDFALWLAASALKADGQEVAALTISDIQESIDAGGNISTEFQKMRQFDQRPGDFGVEILGTLLIPILVEAGKELWSSYLKRLTEQTGNQLADLTLETAKNIVRRAWSQERDLPQRYAALVRAEAQRQGLSSDQIDRLASAVTDPKMEMALSET